VAPPGQSAIIGPPQGECSYNSVSQTYFDTAGNVCLTNGKDWGATGCGSDAAFAVILSPAQGSCSFNSATGTYMDPAGRTCWSDGKYWFTQ
jgi:hypothetical protein